jgi:excinuclease UvrABC ATPase subunit
MSKPPANSVIRLRGVRQNNLKNFDLDVARNSPRNIMAGSG